VSVSDFIQLQNLQVGWQAEKPVCKIDSLALNKKEITVLCGPNGAGKSTLLKTIARQIAPLSGAVRIGGQDLSTIQPLQLAKTLAYVPQFIEMRRCLTVGEWVALGRNPHQKWWSWSISEDDRNKIANALQRTSVSELKSKMIDELSGGERQRVLIATALAQEPSFLLLDEPTAHLDFRHQLELLDLLKTLREEGLGILIVLHDLNLTARIADQVVLLNERNGNGCSELAARGSVADVLSVELLKKVYGVEMEIVQSKDSSQTCYLPSRISDFQ
jgi:iron complex transport system ATP-binding protein